MSDGKKVEKLVRLIQEALKNVPNTKIFSNHKIPNQGGRKREFDVFISALVNNVELNIAIECKDYKKPVSVEKIEAFNSKCLRIRGISKKVFVATNGYQADAYGAATDFDIDLYNLQEISQEKIIEWYPIKKLDEKIKLKTPFDLHLIGSEEDIKSLQSKREFTVHFFDKNPSILLTGFVWNAVVVPKHKEIQNYMTHDFMKGNCRPQKLSKISFSLKVSGVYILGDDYKKYPIAKIVSEVVCWFEESPINILEARLYEKLDSNPAASTVSIDVGKDAHADIVFTSNNTISIFHTTKDGETFPLETLATYDQMTDTFTYNHTKKNE